MRSLDQIGLSYPTDKGSAGHDFLSLYDELFGSLRDRPINLIEFGVKFGGSIRLWEDAFPRAAVIGVDIALDRVPANTRFKRAKLIEADLSDRAQVEAVCRAHGPFDIAIDDSAHTSAVTRSIVEVLLPDWIKPGGWLVIEDINSGYKTGLRPEQIHDQVDYCMSLVKTVQFHGRLSRSGPKFWPKDATPLELAMKQIIYRPGVMAIQRR